MISCCRQSTLGTLMPSLRQWLADCCTTETGLTRAARIDVHQLTPSLCRFVRKLADEPRPSSVIDRLGEHATRQPFDVQILDSDHAIGIDQLTCNFMLKVSPLVLDLGMRFLEQQHGFAAILPTSLPASDTPLSQAQLGLRSLVVARIVDGRPIGERRKGGQAHIDARMCVGGRQQLSVNLDTEAGIPFTACALDRDRLDSTIDWAMQFDLEVSNALHVETRSYQ